MEEAKEEQQRVMGLLGEPEKPSNRVSSRVLVTAEAPPKPERELFIGEEIRGQEIQDDTNNFLGYLAYMAKVAKEEGTLDQLTVQPDNMDEEKAKRLAILVSQ
jgi:hypothetical protein